MQQGKLSQFFSTMNPVKKLKVNNSSQGSTIRQWKWKLDEEGLIWGKTTNFSGSKKVAMFDMDGNLVIPKGKNKHPKGKDDWKFLSSNIIPKIQSLNKKGYSIVIASNQLGISKGYVTSDEITQKVQNFSNEFDVEIACLLATAEDLYRKPFKGMWEFYVDCLNDGEEPDLEDCFYVGDAAGRAKTKSRKKDHSSSDRYTIITTTFST